MTLESCKTYDLKNGWGVNCFTRKDFFGRKLYVIEVVMLTVPWQECVERYERWDNPQECNRLFKEMVAKYKQL